MRSFIERIFDRSGLGEKATFLPKAIHPKYCGKDFKTDLDSAALECRACVFGAIEGAACGLLVSYVYVCAFLQVVHHPLHSSFSNAHHEDSMLRLCFRTQVATSSGNNSAAAPHFRPVRYFLPSPAPAGLMEHSDLRTCDIHLADSIVL